jgi:transposase
MWTTESRARHDRDKLRYPSDLTDDEWALVEPLIPPAKRGGRKRTKDERELVNGIMYVLSTSCQWRYVPKDLPPKSTLHDYLDRWNYDGTLEKIHHTLYVKCREQAGREASPTACVIDSQSVKSAEKGGACIDPNGYDAGKKIKGKKRHILVDTIGLLLHAVVHPADIQDRDGGALVLSTLFGMYPFLLKLFADAGYQGPQFQSAVMNVMPQLSIEIVKRSDQATGFVVLPRRWVVERTLAWLGRCRRLAKDFENLTRTAVAFIRLASIRLMLRRLCNPS